MEAPFRDGSYTLLIGTSDCDTGSIIGSNYTYHESRIIDNAPSPSEARNYIIASTTSRKDEVPVRLAKQVVPVLAKSRAVSFNDGVGELRDDSSAPSIDPIIVEQIKSEERRRRKAISARKSRQRRLEQMEELEKERNDLLKVVHEYHHYIHRLREYFGSWGISIPEPPFARPSSSERFDLSSQTNHGCLI